PGRGPVGADRLVMRSTSMNEREIAARRADGRTGLCPDWPDETRPICGQRKRGSLVSPTLPGYLTYRRRNPSLSPPETATMNTAPYHAHALDLIRRTSAVLPPDVTEVIETHRALEQAGSKADLALALVAQNITLAKRLSAPICQDTGTITFYVTTPVGFDQIELEKTCEEAV